MEEQENAMSGGEYLDTPLTMTPMGDFINKSAYAGESKTAVITSATPHNKFKGKWVIGVKLDDESEEKLITCGPKNINQLILLFGNIPKDWLKNQVLLDFGDSKTYEIVRDGIKETKEGVELDFLKV